MICEISLGKSFFHTISYCLEDKRTLTEEQKISLSKKDGLQHKDRAEVLGYNQCFGNKKELAEQFKEVRRLSKRVEKPVLHLMMRLAPGERLSSSQWLEVAEEMTKEMGVENNQYLVVQHRDTAQEHIHIVANRVGYNGKAASTSNNFYKMDKLCRRLEKQYHLQQVLSPKQFLPKGQRQLPRHDQRKEKMKADIQHSLYRAKCYEDFASGMQALGYQVIKGRGISFIDDKKMRVKGSELGYSLATIEKRLQQKQALKVTPEKMTAVEKKKEGVPSPKPSPAAADFPPQQRLRPGQSTIGHTAEGLEKTAVRILEVLLKQEYEAEQSPVPDQLKWPYKKKKKRQRPG